MNVVLLFGGVSPEHEVSCRSARFILTHLKDHAVSTVGIGKDNQWYLQDSTQILQDPKQKIQINIHEDHPVDPLGLLRSIENPVVFPMMHGPKGEDGTVQGMLEFLDLPYVGCNSLASALAMHKGYAKDIVRASGLHVGNYFWFTEYEWQENQIKIENQLSQLPGPWFVKPIAMGSSVGISKITQKKDFEQAVVQALQHDNQVIVESEVRGRELEIAILGKKKLFVSLPGEIKSGNEFYTYEEKYSTSSQSTTHVPAHLDPTVTTQIQQYALDAAKILNLFGMARIDLFYDEDEQKIYFNEANTIPGCTEISLFPKLLEVSGITPPQMVEQLLKDATQHITN